jgi:hypothetical protein
LKECGEPEANLLGTLVGFFDDWSDKNFGYRLLCIAGMAEHA